MKKSIKLSLFSVLAGGYGLLNPTNVLAACSPGVENGVDITCDGNINTPQSFTDASRITATINACTQIDVTAQRSKKMPKRRTHARIQEQLKAINPVLANPAEFRASLKR